MVERPPPADSDNTRDQRRRALWLGGVGLAALGVLVVLLLACVLWIPRRLYPPLTETDFGNVSDAARVQELKDTRLKLQNDARTTLLQGLGAVLVLTGAGVTLRQIRETATANRNQLKLSEQGQVTDRYTKAIDQLDDKKALAVRLGGLYALERIAHDSPADRATIAEVLCAYARTAPRPKPPARRAEDGDPSVADAAPAGTPAAEPPSLTVRAPDVQAAVSILGRWRERLGELPPVLDLHNADLQGAQLRRAWLEGAHLEGVQLQGADLLFAWLQDAWLQDAWLRGADLEHAVLWDAHLSGAHLQDVDLEGADLLRAHLFGAHLQGAKNLDGAELRGAQASKATRWPEGWDHARAEAAGVQFVDLTDSLIPGEADVRVPEEPAPPPEEQP